MPDLHRYSVGELYSLVRQSWPETPQFNHRSNSTELILFFPSPSPAEVYDVGRGEAEFALLAEGDLIAFLYRFGRAVPWSDAVYSWHLVPEVDRTLPNLTEARDPHLLLAIMLVDATTGIIRMLRTVSLSPAFSTALALAIRAQSERPWPGNAEYDCQIADLYQRYPESRNMLRAAQVRCVGGRD